MENFFDPNSIVIFGASKDERKGGNHVIRNILNYTDQNLYLIHPEHEEIYGIKCYKALDEVPIKKIDLGIIILPVEYVLDALEQCIDYKIGTVVIESGDLYLKGENDEKNQKRLERLNSKLMKSSTRVLGPNSIGFYCAHKNKKNLITSLIYFDKLPEMKEKNLSIISQTGLTLSGILQGQNYIQEFGIAKIAAIGNKFDVNASDVLDIYEKDPDTNAIGLYLEDIKEGQRFKEQCSRIAKKKPIILLKSGRTEKGKKAIISHTKSLAGNYKIIEALSKQIGLIIVDDFNEMFQIAKLLLTQPIPKNNRIAVISISGAGTVLSCDLAEIYGLELPPMTPQQKKFMQDIFPRFAWDDVYNPLDIWSSVEYVGPEKAYLHAGEVFLKENNKIDALIYFLTGIEETEFDWKKLHQLNTKYNHIPIYMGFLGGNKKLLLQWREELEEKFNIPTFESINILMKSISKVLQLKLEKEII
jgi:acyl-CoA synthetase (NDP forming)